MDVVSDNANSLESQLSNTVVGTRNDLEISRHVFLGEVSYIVRDPVSFEGHNLTPTDFEIFTNLTEELPLHEICSLLVEKKLFDESQTESFYEYVVELQKRNLLSLPLTDGESLFQQYEQRQRQRKKNPLMKLLSFRVPLGSPDQFLKATYHCVHWMFTKTFFLLWIIGLLCSFVLISAHWSEFTSDLSSALAVNNLFTMLIVMSVLKFWHELGHGYACRHYGVSVPKAGLMFMFGTPLAFMDATGSWSLPNRHQRQVINLAGIYFESMAAIIASFVWVFSEGDFVRSVAHFTLLISSVTTIAFNINPLMKYDGYFVLADALGIPNLKSRSGFALQSLAKRLFFGLPLQSKDSLILRAILVTYGIASSLYRIGLTIGIGILLATQIWLVGLLAGIYYVLFSFGSMALSVTKYLLWSNEVQEKRQLAFTYWLILIVIIPAALLSAPLPNQERLRGVVESQEIAIVHAEQTGFVEELFAKSGDVVSTGQVLCKIKNFESTGELMLKSAMLDRQMQEFRHHRNRDVVMSAKTSKEIVKTKFELASLGTLNSINEISATSNGVLLEIENNINVGQHVEAGDEVFRIANKGWVIRTIVDSSTFAGVRPEIGQEVECRLPSHPAKCFQGKVFRVSPSGNKVVPYKALTHLAGGTIPVDPNTMKAAEPFFEVSIEVEKAPSQMGIRNGLVCDVQLGNKKSSCLGLTLYRSILRFLNQIELNS